MTDAPLPEGWYRDPSLPATRRWWDGTAWTDHVRPDEDAGLGLGSLRRSAASAASVASPASPAVSEAMTFAVPSELEGTKPVSSVGSAAAGDAFGGGSWRAETPPWAESSAAAPSGAQSSAAVPAGAGSSVAVAGSNVAVPSGPGSFAAPTSVAELESVDYAPMERSWGASAVAAPVRRTPLAAGTAGAWLLALSPLLNLLLAAGVGALVLVDPVSPVSVIVAWIATALVLVWLVLAVIADFRRLGALGYASRPSVFWIVLGPLPYLISRTVHVRRGSGRGSGPLWVFLVVSVLAGAAGVGFLLWMGAGTLTVPGVLGAVGLQGW
ncbi:MAG: DUF2510 domain-containing protein [Microcella sp.]|uniref:DUF2510 domain-containing protein n=1 Tax=Microcella sp. TaxID=1913979 RepID=UPI0033146089